jgi:hypothetical protein
LFHFVELAVLICIDFVESTGEGTGNFILGEEAVTVGILFLQANTDLFGDASDSLGLLSRLSGFPPLCSFLRAARQGNTRVKFYNCFAGRRRVLSLGSVRGSAWR